MFERGEGGTPHTHSLISSKKPIAFETLQKRFSHSHIDVLQGTIKDGLDYIYKRGKREGKASTQLCRPVSWGECFIDNRGSSGNKTFDVIEEMLEDGYGPNDIYATSAKLFFYAGAIERTYNARKLSEIPIFRNVHVEYHVGKPGTGKTYEYRKLCEQGLVDEIHLVSRDYKNPWDGYDHRAFRLIENNTLYGLLHGIFLNDNIYQ